MMLRSLSTEISSFKKRGEKASGIVCYNLKNLFLTRRKMIYTELIYKGLVKAIRPCAANLGIPAPVIAGADTGTFIPFMRINM